MIDNQSENIENSTNKLEDNTEVNSPSVNPKTNNKSTSKVDAEDSSTLGEEDLKKNETILESNIPESLLKNKQSLENVQDISNTDARLEQLEKEHETLKNQYIRIAADFENFRKRQSRDQDDLKIQLICKSLTAILPIVDNFERARQQLKPESEEAQTLHRSYQGLYKQLVDVLKQQGVAPMRVVGQQFDPSLHEAVLREPSEEQNEDVIIEELQRGYHLDGKVLRHALVKVSMGPGPSANSQDQKEQDKVEEELSSDNDFSDEK
tara:strand:- start:8507 stop:9301 length:795 start_codon:yes stop_codon:yes gene_type:complete